MLMMPTTRQMHETTAVFNTHGVVVQRMIDKVMIMAPILIMMMMIMTPILVIMMMIMAPILIIIKTSNRLERIFYGHST